MADVDRLAEELRGVARGVLDRWEYPALDRSAAPVLAETVANAIALHLCSEDRVVAGDQRALALRLACGLGQDNPVETLDAADQFLAFLQGRSAVSGV